MSCVVGAPNVKFFGKAIHALARIGDDLYIETQSSKLLFRTINSSKSAYASFIFDSSFFVQYDGNTKTNCKILLKSFIMAFRSLLYLEKTVEKCTVDLLNMEDFLLLQFVCKHDMTKNYHLPYTENETVQADFLNTGFLCKLVASSRLLHDGVQNFNYSVEEITLTVCSNKVILKNYVDDESDPNKVVHTEITLQSQEFEAFEVEEETEVTFCLKELKAILLFSEGCSVPIIIQCQTSGKPITFTIDSINGMQGDFLLATLAETNTQSTSRSAQKNPLPIGPQTKVRGSSAFNPTPNKKESYNNPIPGNPQSRQSSQVSVQSSKAGSSKDHDAGDCEVIFDNHEPAADDMDEDFVPSTPPKKKFRSQFLGLSQATYTSMAPDPDEVLVPDSDDDT